MSPTLPVVVVGAGPTGSAAALALAARGVRTVVVERWPEVYPQPRAVHLDDEVYRVLVRLGLEDDLARLTRPCAGLRLVDAHLRVLASFDRSGASPVTGYPRANMFDQPVLDAVLRERLRSTPEVTLLTGREVVGVEQESADRVVVLHRPLDDDGPQERLEASFLLGCDGANSVVRRELGGRMVDLGFEQRWLVVDVDTDVDLGHWDGVHQMCDSTRAATFMRVGARRYRWELQLLDDETADDLASLPAVLPLLRPWLDDVDAADLQLVRSTGYTFRAAVAERWRWGRVLLLGDAAHLTPPFVGQGMGAGIRDVDNLVWKVAGVLDGALPADVLDTYEVERSAHARAMILLARRVGVLMSSGGRLGDHARGAVLPLVARSARLYAGAVDSATPALVRSSLVLRSRGDRLAGTLCPNVAGGGATFDRLVGHRWALVTAVPPSPSAVEELASRDVAVVEVGPAAGGTLDRLATWLAEAGCAAALVRPDRTVMASGTDLPALVATATSLLLPVRTEVPA